MGYAVECQDPKHVNVVDGWQPAEVLWTCTSPDGQTTIRCEGHGLPLELAGWTLERIRVWGEGVDSHCEWGSLVGVN